MSRVVDLLLLLVVILFRACLPCTVEIHDGWRACRVPADPSQGCGDDESVLMMVSRLPVTALTVLLGNRQIAGAEHLTLDDLYYSTNLALLPDIHRVGREYYTLLYQIDIAAMNDTTSYCLGGDDDDKISLTRQTIRFAGINYRARTWLDGHPLVELEQPDGRDVPGMFVRRIYDVTDGGRFNLLIAPPDHPGIPDPGQGGNHDLAQDGAVPQFMLGWDWCQAMPDRATGFHGSTILERSGLWTVQDPAIQTVQLLNCTSLLANHHQCSSVVLQILARVEGGGGPAHDDSPATAPAVSTLTVTSDWGEIWRIPIASPTRDVCVPVTVQHPEQIKLWWPAGVGMENFAHRHTFTFSLAVNGKVSNVKTIQAGIRTIETFLDEKIQGQLFRINSQDVYLVGGNFIATDQALRYSASEARYCAEISLHRHAGLNLLRVWGGGTAQPDQFYDCADRLGVLVFQEFWMTGDNNGRWAGNYSWPLDYSAYLANVEDTVKRLRRHPSLLFYGGCNECLAPRSSTWAPNPPNQIDDGIRKVIDQYDPGRFYIASSMGGVSTNDNSTGNDEMCNLTMSCRLCSQIRQIRSLTPHCITIELIRWPLLTVRMACCSRRLILIEILVYLSKISASGFNLKSGV